MQFYERLEDKKVELLQSVQVVAFPHFKQADILFLIASTTSLHFIHFF